MYRIVIVNSLDHERRSNFMIHDVAIISLCLILSKSQVASRLWTSCSIIQTSKSSTIMAEASSTAISSAPCHLGGITRLAFAPDGQYVSTTRCNPS